MAGITTLGNRTSIATLYDLFYYTRGRLARHGLTQVLLADLDVLRPELDTAGRAEFDLMAIQHEVNAGVEFVDDGLDTIADRISSAILIETKGDRSAPLYLRYYGSQRPSELKRPILGGQLETMRTWSPSLKDSHNPALQQCGTELEAQVTQADTIETEKVHIEQQITDFRTVGMRAKLIEHFNAVRKELFGKLSRIQHANPQLGTGWAESFFRQGSESERLTIRELERRIAVAETQLATLRTQRDELLARDEQVEQARLQAERAAKQAELEAARRAAAELTARVAELEADLGNAQARKK